MCMTPDHFTHVRTRAQWDSAGSAMLTISAHALVDRAVPQSQKVPGASKGPKVAKTPRPSKAAGGPDAAPKSGKAPKSTKNGAAGCAGGKTKKKGCTKAGAGASAGGALGSQSAQPSGHTQAVGRATAGAEDHLFWPALLLLVGSACFAATEAAKAYRRRRTPSDTAGCMCAAGAGAAHAGAGTSADGEASYFGLACARVYGARKHADRDPFSDYTTPLLGGADTGDAIGSFATDTEYDAGAGEAASGYVNHKANLHHPTRSRQAVFFVPLHACALTRARVCLSVFRQLQQLCPCCVLAVLAGRRRAHVGVCCICRAACQ